MRVADLGDVCNRTPLDFSIGFVVFQSRFFLNKGQ